MVAAVAITNQRKERYIMLNRGNKKTASAINAMSKDSTLRQIWEAAEEEGRTDLNTIVDEECSRGMSPGCNQVSRHRGSADRIRRNYKL